MTNKSSVNKNELNKFDKTPEEWWDNSGEFKILHKINPLRIQYVTDKISEYFPSSASSFSDLKLIDIGCGGGLISAPLSGMGIKVTALDANKNSANYFQGNAKDAKNKELPIDFVNSTIEEYVKVKKNLGAYDVVLCLEVIEHVDNPREFVQNLTKLLKPNGIIIISTINRTLEAYVQAIIMAEYVLRWVKPCTHDHSKFIKPSELNNMLTATDCHLKELTGLKFNPMVNSWYFSDNISVNYFAVIAKN